MEKNKLKQCLSPYLQQHADNPVHWQPWGPEALEQAKARNKPILLSIGYSACHWCHVMAHESFEDETTAELMNRNFINIKVDREERPDLDKIYQTTHQLLNQQSGGWPLTVFLEPKTQTPFFSGTYFPKEARFNLPSFKTVLNVITELYANQSQQIQTQNKQLKLALKQLATPEPSAEVHFSSEPIEMAIDVLEEDFDEIHGGFGGAPKFPLPTHLQRLLRRYHGTPRDEAALHMLQTTLNKMAEGGIYDQLGGGFYRYSVDNHWEIPHFEKMLYDNGPLLAIYAQAAILLKTPYYKTIAQGIANWALQTMLSPEGGFYATIDADSLGIEGKFYTWDKAEIKEQLKQKEYKIFAATFNLDQTQNFEKQWHLHQVKPIAALNAKECTVCKCAIEKLLTLRKSRIAPNTDKKILTSWNALMIRGLSIAGFLFQEDNYIKAANHALQFIKIYLFHHDTLYACYMNNKAYNLAYLDDYAFLLDAVLFQLQAKFDPQMLQFAITLAEQAIQRFYDNEHGGFYYTDKNHEDLIQRPKTFMDEALPSGNGIIAFALNRLGHLIGNVDYLDIAEHTVKCAWKAIESAPSAHQNLLHALEEMITPPELLMIVYQSQANLSDWRQAVIEHYNPHRLCFFIPEATCAKIEKFAGFQLDNHPVGAWLCKGSHCLPPVFDVSTLFTVE